MNKKAVWIVVAFIVVIIIAVAVKSPGSSSSLNQPVKIGGIFNQVGFAAFAGEASRDGFIMAIEDSGLGKDKVEYVIEDPRSDFKQAAVSASKLIDVDKAVAIVGPEWTEFGEVLAPIAEKNKVPFISPWIAAEATFIKPPYFWSATASYRGEHTALASHMTKYGLNKISVVYSKNAWSYEDLRIFKEEIAKFPSLKIISEDSHEQTSKDFRTTVAKIKAAKPDLIYVAMAEDESHGIFSSQVKQAGITASIAAFSGRLISPVLHDRFAKYLPGQIYAASVPASKSDEFASKYEKRFGKKVGAPSAAGAYDAATVYLNAIKAGARTSDEIIAYMQKMPAFEGYSGMIKYDEKGRLPLPKTVMKRYNDKSVAEIIN